MLFIYKNMSGRLHKRAQERKITKEEAIERLKTKFKSEIIYYDDGNVRVRTDMNVSDADLDEAKRYIRIAFGNVEMTNLRKHMLIRKNI